MSWCESGTCLNAGVCKSLLLNYSCLCLSGSYSGEVCQIRAQRLTTFQIISKSFGYMAIVSIVGVGMFVAVMDVLKYVFGIDPVDRKRQAMKSRKMRRRKKAVQMIRFTYIPGPAQELHRNINTTVQNTTV